MTRLAEALARLAGGVAAAYVAEYRKRLAPAVRTQTELSCTAAVTSAAWRPTHQATMPARSFGFGKEAR
jgi:hypothetical protein